MRRALAAFGAILALAAPASAHDYWADGKPIPNWVKASCCGPADAHHLRPDQVHRVSDDYYEVDDYHGNGGKIPSPRHCPARTATIGYSTETMLPISAAAEASPESTASSSRWRSDMENIFHRRRAEEVLDSAFARIDLPSTRLEAFDYYTPRAPKKRSRGRKPPAPEPTNNQIEVLMAMQREGRTQVAIANALGVPRSRVRIWYQRRGLAPLTRLEGHMIGRADARARVP